MDTDDAVPTPQQVARRLDLLMDEARALSESLTEAARHIERMSDIGAALERDAFGDRVSS
jgi:hypothetical protein